MVETYTENEVIKELELGDKATEQENAKLEKNIRSGNQNKETKKNLGKLRRNTFFERKGNNIYYKIDTVNNYLKEISTSNKKIKEALLSDRKTIVTAIQIALYKSGSEYLPVGWIDGQRGPITRGAVAKFQNKNGLQGQKNPGYLNVQTINKLIEISTKKETEKKKIQTKEIVKKNTQKSSVTRKETKIPNFTPKVNDFTAKKDNTNVASRTFYESPKGKINLNETLTKIENENLTPKEKMRKNINKLEKKGDSIRKEITSNIGTFREWFNGDYKFEFYDNTGDLPSHINILGENYKYTVDGDNLNGLGFESYYGGHSLRIGEYTDGFLSFGTVYSYDGLRETGFFNITGDLIEGVRIETDGSRHIIEDSIETNNKNLLSF